MRQDSVMAYNGTFKVLFTLLVLAILFLVAYSSWYQSTWLTPSTNKRIEHNTTAVYNTLHGIYTSQYANKEKSVGENTYAVGIVKRPKNSNSTVWTKPTEDEKSETTYSTLISHTDRSTQLNTQGDANILQTNALSHTGYQSHTKSNIQDTLRGYIVVLEVYEQQTMASGNLLQLQCWAKYLNLVVVKPFMKDSSLLTPLDPHKQASMLRMEDTFDMQHWEKYTLGEGYAPLVEWEEFVKTAPRKLIVIQTKYPTLTHVRDIRAKGLPFPHPPSEEKLYTEGCKFKLLKSKGIYLLQSKGFVVVRTVCLNFLTGDELTMKQLQEHILGEFEKDKVSIVIDEWRGLGENQRVLLQEKICSEENAYREHTKPSVRLLRDAEAYTKQYLKPPIGSNNVSNNDYVAVMARYEMTGLTKRLNKDDDPHAIIPMCLQATQQDLEVVKLTRHLFEVFLSIDIGKYGSDSFKNKNYFGHLADMEAFVEKVNQGRMKVRQWESTFETITHTQDSGYIAMLQLVLVTRARCILFVGGGTFQRHALHIYQDMHPDSEDRCIRILNKCTSPYRPVEK